jgi:hypothetical protein
MIIIGQDIASHQNASRAYKFSWRSWVKNNISFNGDIYNQGFNLDKANIKSGYGIGFSSS